MIVRIKYVLLWVFTMVGMWYLSGPQFERLTMTDGEPTTDFALNLFDHGDWAFVPNGDHSEGIEGFSYLIVVYFSVFALVQLIMIIGLLLNTNKEDFAIEGRAFIPSTIVLFLTNFLVLYFLSFLFNVSFNTGAGAIIIGMIIMGIFSIRAGVLFAEDNDGVFNMYNSLKDYFQREVKFKNYINNLNYQYKLKIQ